MTERRYETGDTVVIHCETCEPEAAVILAIGPRCIDCGCQQYRLRTSEASMVVECCSSILRPLH
jgi:hypothetical protein